ncbi:hypothetical protein ACHAWT_010862 [Skeletonema menzelii]
MTDDQQVAHFTEAFNRNRATLALFSKCSTKDELDVVRDAFFLGMASQLCPNEYESIRECLITDESAFDAIASSINTDKGLETTVTAARASPHWLDLVTAVHAVSNTVGSDLDGIWTTLEKGRLDWLGAVAAAHPLKVILKEALDKDKNKTERDEVDMKMVYIYALSLSIESLANESEAWRKVVRMTNKANPLQDYNVDLWDPRKEEWRPLDLGVQEAAERGGSSFQAAWDA